MQFRIYQRISFLTNYVCVKIDANSIVCSSISGKVLQRQQQVVHDQELEAVVCGDFIPMIHPVLKCKLHCF